MVEAVFVIRPSLVDLETHGGKVLVDHSAAVFGKVDRVRVRDP